MNCSVLAFAFGAVQSALFISLQRVWSEILHVCVNLRATGLSQPDASWFSNRYCNLLLSCHDHMWSEALEITINIACTFCVLYSDLYWFVFWWSEARGDRTQVFVPRHFPPVGYFDRSRADVRLTIFKELHTSLRKRLDNKTVPFKCIERL